MQYIKHTGDTMRSPIVAIIICALICTIGCTEDENENPVTPNYDAARFALIPAGTFRMGNITDHSDGLPDAKPVHEVMITRPFLMSRTEVTQEHYEVVMGNNPSYFSGADMPVEQVSWYEAVAFCNALSLQEGLDPCYSGNGDSTTCDFTANGYRLPTEAEREYACRGGMETDFYTGGMTNSRCTVLDPALDMAGWYCGNSNFSTHPVGLKEPNSFGLYDMHGNVYEWCWDWYSSNYYGSSPGVDPRGPGGGGLLVHRVARGGAFAGWPYSCRSSYRYNSSPEIKYSSIGFRVVRAY
jgi:formylglycine-generating enzyme required for sulfatase activity